MSNKSIQLMRTDSVPIPNCQRCGKDVPSGRVASVSFKDRSMYFCEGCFKSVFKYDESLRTVAQIFEQNGRKTPFTIRSNSWHRASFMIVNEVKPAVGKNGTEKAAYVGDFYLRGVLKEQGHNVGKANHFIWTPWSPEEAAKYKEEASPADPSSEIRLAA